MYAWGCDIVGDSKAVATGGRTPHLSRGAGLALAVLLATGCDSSAFLEKPTSEQVFEEACRALSENGGAFAAAYLEGAMQGVVNRQAHSWDDPAFDDLRARVRSGERSANPDGAALSDCASSFTWFDSAGAQLLPSLS